MTVKTTGDGDTVTTETMADRLRAVQSENWRTLRFTDENEEAAWEVYNESLFLRPTEGEEAAPGEEEKGKETKADAAAAAKDERPLEDAVPHLGRKWDDDQYFEAVFKVKKPKPGFPSDS